MASGLFLSSWDFCLPKYIRKKPITSSQVLAKICSLENIKETSPRLTLGTAPLGDEPCVRVGGLQIMQRHRVPRVWPPGSSVCAVTAACLPEGVALSRAQVPIPPGVSALLLGPAWPHSASTDVVSSALAVTLCSSPSRGFQHKPCLSWHRLTQMIFPTQVAVIKFQSSLKP